MLNNKIRLETAQQPRIARQHGPEGVQLAPGWAISARGHIGGGKTDIGLNFRAEGALPPKGHACSIYTPPVRKYLTFHNCGQ